MVPRRSWWEGYPEPCRDHRLGHGPRGGRGERRKERVLPATATVAAATWHHGGSLAGLRERRRAEGEFGVPRDAGHYTVRGVS